MPSIEERLAKIEERNQKVELDKAWETSFARKVLLAVFTYLVISLFFVVMDIPRPWINAIVPTLGFLISTWSLPYFKNVWIKFHK